MNDHTIEVNPQLESHTADQVWTDARTLARQNPYPPKASKPIFGALLPLLLASVMLIAVLGGISQFDLHSHTGNKSAEQKFSAGKFKSIPVSMNKTPLILSQKLAGETLLSVVRCESGTIQLMDQVDGRCIANHICQGKTPFRAQISKQGGLLVVAYEDNSIGMYDLATGQFSTFAHDFDIFRLAIAPNSQFVAVSGYGGDIVIYRQTDTGAWSLQHYCRLDNQSMNLIEFSPDGGLLFSSSTDVIGRLWDTTTGKLLFQLKGHEQSFSAAEFSADGSELITAGVDGRVIFWDVDSGNTTQMFRDKRYQFTCICYDVAGKRVIIGSTIGQIILFNRVDTTIKSVQHAHRGAVTQLNFHQTQNQIFSNSRDGETIAWKIVDEKFVKKLALRNLLLSEKNRR